MAVEVNSYYLPSTSSPGEVFGFGGGDGLTFQGLFLLP
ncbi:hypothetical protein OOU_Y34scaffold00275g46 [Pyricularia oryzae Y34]|uniref:Uncharacterized protein n=4 Tax=Pyricularia oryzae TaxID=318829 RepID=Q2KF96_PYRO7|nr:hypothetical protein MGCH7_ch7g790 [Pyricularia oryzae 70-15]ELQ41530.1 hypothetical protein OOU_Y34scaffold00275g46 [Pyricularia oryzae Y34]QBZ65683.1 hypothetical protein PoMZ_12646 [Pyricularia oryzae]